MSLLWTYHSSLKPNSSICCYLCERARLSFSIKSVYACALLLFIAHERWNLLDRSFITSFISIMPSNNKKPQPVRMYVENKSVRFCCYKWMNEWMKPILVAEYGKSIVRAWLVLLRFWFLERTWIFENYVVFSFLVVS